MLLALHSLIGVCARDAAGQGPPARKPLPFNYVVYKGDMTALLAKVAREAGINIGLEVYPWRPIIPVEVELSDPTIEDFLNAVVKSAPGYQWREVGGDFEVSSPDGRCPLLDARVGDFEVSGVTQAEAVGRLLDTPEVRAAMGELNLRYQRRDGPPSRDPGERFSLSAKGMSVRQALHRIAERSGGRFWSFGRYGNQREGELYTIRTPGMW